MNALKYYVSTTRIVLQGDPETPSTWPDLNLCYQHYESLLVVYSKQSHTNIPEVESQCLLSQETQWKSFTWMSEWIAGVIGEG